MFAIIALAAAAAQPVFPEAQAKALCQLYVRADPVARAAFWQQADAQFDLSPRQQIEVRVFCLGYQRGLTDQLERQKVRRHR